MNHFRHQQYGVSLIELMIALVLGLLVIAGIASVFIQNNKVRVANERISSLSENGRYAMKLLAEDIQNAGYLGEFNAGKSNSTTFVPPAAKPDPCVVTLTALVAAMPLHVQGYDNAATAPVTCITDFRAGTDVIVIRRVSTCSPSNIGNCSDYTAGERLFQVSQCNDSTELGAIPPVAYRLSAAGVTAMTLRQRDCLTPATIRRYLTRIYYVANNNKAGDGIPTLKRVELNSGSAMSAPVSIAEGVENLQIEYGLDTDNDGALNDVTASPDGYSSCTTTTTPTCMGRWRQVIQARLYLLARSTSRRPGFTDAATYAMGSLANGNAQTIGPLGGSFERRLNQMVVLIRNPAGRNATQ